MCLLLFDFSLTYVIKMYPFALFLFYNTITPVLSPLRNTGLYFAYANHEQCPHRGSRNSDCACIRYLDTSG